MRQLQRNRAGFGQVASLLCLAMLTVVLAGPEASLARNPDDSGYVQFLESGSIDWQTGRVTGVGLGSPPPDAVNSAQGRAMAQRAATVVARRNLLEIIQGVNLNADTTVRNFLVEDDVVRSKVQGFLQNSQVVDVKFFTDGTAEVTVEVYLRGAFADVMMPPTRFAPAVVPAPTTVPTAAPTPLPTPTPKPPRLVPDIAPTPGPLPTAAPSVSNLPYTGLVIDAAGLEVRPAMSPRILDEDGNEVYGTSKVGREYAIEQGMAGYAKDLAKAALNPRVADNPLIIKAEAVTGEAKTDLVISREDAARLRAASGSGQFLKQSRVMIVLD